LQVEIGHDGMNRTPTVTIRTDRAVAKQRRQE
jgi:hypothetical protein